MNLPPFFLKRRTIASFLIGTLLLSFSLGEGFAFSIKGFLRAPGREVGNAIGGFFGGVVGGATGPTIDQTKNAGKELIATADKAAEERIKQVDGVMKARIEQVDTAMKNRIDQIDDVLKNRTQDVDRVLASRIAQVDGILEERIQELDALTETRVGNVDVVATKAAFTFEEVFKRVLASACIMAFLTFAFWLIYKESVAALASLRAQNGTINSWWGATKAVLRATRVRLALTAAAAIVLILTLSFLPGGPSARRAELKRYHSGQMASALESMDFRDVTYHASQLKILGATDHQTTILLAKEDLAKELFIRSTATQTADGITRMLQMFDAADKLQAGTKSKDADIYILKGLFLWRIATDRYSENVAIGAMAKGLNTKPEKDGLSPSFRGIAASYVLNYLDAPLGRVDEMNYSELADGSLEQGLLETTAFVGISIKEIGELTKKEFLLAAVDSVLADGGKLTIKPRENEDVSLSARYIAKIKLPPGYLPYALYNASVSELRLKSNPQYARMVLAWAGREREDFKAAAIATHAAWKSFGDDVIRNTNPSLEPQIALAPFLLPDAIQARALVYRDMEPPVDKNEIVDVGSVLPSGGVPSAAAGEILRSRLDKEVMSKMFMAGTPVPSSVPRGSVYGMISYDETLRFQEHEDNARAFELAIQEWRKFEINSEAGLTALLRAAEHAARLGLIYWDAESGARPMEDYLMYEQKDVDKSQFKANPAAKKQLTRVHEAKLRRHRGLL